MELQNFIDGKFVPASEHVDSLNPSTGQVYARVPDSTPDIVDLAVQAAERAMPGWGAKSAKQRSDIPSAGTKELASVTPYYNGPKNNGKSDCNTHESSVPVPILTIIEIRQY